MPELLEQATAIEERLPLRGSNGPGSPPPRPAVGLREVPPRRVREDLRGQIARMERELVALFGSAFPRKGIEFTVGAVGGPRVLDVEELERLRDTLAGRLAQVRGELHSRAYVEERKREVLERMITEPERYRWVRVSNEDIGEPGCRHWHSRPRYGLVGWFMGWWRVKLSSGCPLAEGRGPAPPRHQTPHSGSQDAQEAPPIGKRGARSPKAAP